MAGTDKEISVLNALKDTFEGVGQQLSKSLDVVSSFSPVNISTLKNPIESLNNTILGVMPPMLRDVTEKIGGSLEGFGKKLLDWNMDNDKEDDTKEENFRKEQKETSKKQIGVFQKIHQTLEEIKFKFIELAGVNFASRQGLNTIIKRQGDDLREHFETQKQVFQNFRRVQNIKEETNQFRAFENKIENKAKDKIKGEDQKETKKQVSFIGGLFGIFSKFAGALLAILGTTFSIAALGALLYNLPEILENNKSSILSFMSDLKEAAISFEDWRQERISEMTDFFENIATDLNLIMEGKFAEKMRRDAEKDLQEWEELKKGMKSFIEDITLQRVPEKPKTQAELQEQANTLDTIDKLMLETGHRGSRGEELRNRLAENENQRTRVEEEREKMKSDMLGESVRNIISNTVINNTSHNNVVIPYRNQDSSLKRHQDKELNPQTP